MHIQSKQSLHKTFSADVQELFIKFFGNIIFESKSPKQLEQAICLSTNCLVLHM